MATLYSNENFPLPVVEELRRLGHDVVTIQERGRASDAVSDQEVLRLAISESRAVLTLNCKDFIELHRQEPTHHGIIVCTVDSDFGGQAKRIDDALRGHVQIRGQLIRVNRPA